MKSKPLRRRTSPTRSSDSRDHFPHLAAPLAVRFFHAPRKRTASGAAKWASRGHSHRNLFYFLFDELGFALHIFPSPSSGCAAKDVKEMMKQIRLQNSGTT